MAERTTTICPDGLHTRGAHNDEHMAWSGVREIVHDKAHIFAFLGSHHAFVFPERALPQSMSLEDFETRLRTLQEASQPQGLFF